MLCYLSLKELFLYCDNQVYCPKKTGKDQCLFFIVKLNVNEKQKDYILSPVLISVMQELKVQPEIRHRLHKILSSFHGCLSAQCFSFSWSP